MAWGEASNKRQPVKASVRRAVLARDGHRCTIRWDAGCTSVATECDHIVGRSAGGSDEPHNLRAACHHCNARRNYDTQTHRDRKRRPTEPPPGLLPPAHS